MTYALKIGVTLRKSQIVKGVNLEHIMEGGFMRWIVLVILSGFIVQASQAASLDGLWTGWGEWTFDGSGTSCPTMQLHFKETQHFLERVKGYFDCQVVGLETYPAKWLKRGNTLMIPYQAQGSYNGQQLKIKELYGNEGVSIQTSIQIEGLHMDYKEIWYEADGDVLYEITGRLFKKEK